MACSVEEQQSKSGIDGPLPPWLTPLAGALTAASTLLTVLVTIVALPKQLGLFLPLTAGYFGYNFFRRKVVRKIGVFFLAVCLASSVYVGWSFAAPEGHVVFYGGELLDYKAIPFNEGSTIRLTADPHQGKSAALILMDPTDASRFTVTCWENGVIAANDASGNVERLTWVRISDGKWEGLWAPLGFIRGIAPGTALQLLPCTDWRWRIQSLLGAA